MKKSESLLFSCVPHCAYITFYNNFDVRITFPGGSIIPLTTVSQGMYSNPISLTNQITGEVYRVLVIFSGRLLSRIFTLPLPMQCSINSNRHHDENTDIKCLRVAGLTGSKLPPVPNFSAIKNAKAVLNQLI